jgi:hypothetical protein
MLKHALTGTGLAIGVTLLSASQVLAADFFIDTFDSQFTGPCQIISGPPPAGTCTTNQTTGTTANPLLQTGTSFPTSATSPAFIRDPSGLPPNQVIGESRNLELYSIINPGGTLPNGSSTITNTSASLPPAFWQVRTSNASRVSSSMIWNNIDPFAAPTVSNSGKFVDRLRRGALSFQTAGVVQGSPLPEFQNIFTFVLRDRFGYESRVSRRAITSNQFVFITFEEFRASANSVLFDLNAINYVELNVVTGGGSGSTVRVNFVRGFEIPEPSLVLGLGIVSCVGYLSTKGSRARENEDSL